MGKKKHKNKGKHAKHDRAEVRVDLSPQLAGIAAAALQQVNTPAFRQMVVGALGAAAQAFDQRRSAPGRPAPEPVAAPAAPPAPGHVPRFETPEIRLSPDVAQTVERIAADAGKAIEQAAALAARGIETASEALERWAQRQRGPGRGDDPAAERPRG